MRINDIKSADLNGAKVGKFKWSEPRISDGIQATGLEQDGTGKRAIDLLKVAIIVIRHARQFGEAFLLPLGMLGNDQQ